MKVYKGKTFADVYKLSLLDVLNNPEYETSPRGSLIREITNAALVIENPEQCLYLNDRRSSQFKYIAAELIWYFSGHNDTSFISKFAKFWESIDNGNGTVNSAYGNLIFREKNRFNISQYQWALESLIKDKDSRQAILHFNKPSHQWEGNKDFVCTLTGVLQIRDSSLNFTIDMRSNDLILGTPTDAAFFVVLQNQMYCHLKKYYPDLKIGTYTHIAHSLHIYERHFGLVEEMLKNEFVPIEIPNINCDLIEMDGSPMEAIIKIKECIERDINIKNDVKFGDSLYDWIIDNVFI